jgi:2-dehydropantoate 2-reductase
MRVLVVGAGAVGGYFGGRLLQANRDVTFLVRTRRAAELAKYGLSIRSRFGDADIANPPVVLAEQLREDYDLILLTVKAYDLESAMDSFAPAVGASTAIIPLLNGMRHLDTLDARFGASHVLGGRCLIGVTLGDEQRIVHLNENHELTFGERDGSASERIAAIAALMQNVPFEARASREILLEMWEKWVFLASLAGATCLMRATVGDVAGSPGGKEFVLRLVEECRAVAEAQSYAPRDPYLQRLRGMLTATGSGLTTSLLRDIARNSPVEADHIIGDLLARADAAKVECPLLRLVYTHLKCYEARRAREISAAAGAR